MTVPHRVFPPGNLAPIAALVLLVLAPLLLGEAGADEDPSSPREKLASVEAEYGPASAEAAAARDALLESLWQSPNPPDSTALELAESTVALKRNLYGDSSIEVAKSLYGVAVIHDRQEGPLASRPYFEEVVAVLDAAPDEPGLFHARAQYALGQNLARLGELDAALECYQTAREIYAQREGPESADVADVLAATGKLYLSMGRPEDAEGEFREAVALREENLGPEDPLTCELQTNLAACSYYMGDFGEAGRRQRVALDCLRQTLPEDDPRILHGLKNLAWLESEYGNYGAADSAYVRILQLQEARVGVDDPSTLELYRIYGAHLYLSGAYSDALIMVQRAVDGLIAVLGPAAPQTDSAISTLAEIHRVLGNYEDARRLYDESAENLEASGSQQPALALRYNGLGLVALDLGDAAEARRWFEMALALSREYEGETHYHTARAYANLGDAEALDGKADRALELYAQAMEIFETELGAESPDTVQSAVLLGRVLGEHGDLDEASRVLDESYTALVDQEQPAYLGMNRHELAHVRLRQERYAEAAELETEAIENLALAHGEESHPVASSLVVRGWARLYLGELDAAFADAQLAESIGRTLTTDLIPWLPERTALAWAQRRPQGSSLMWEVARRSGDPAQVEIAWDATVLTRAWILDELGRRARIAAAQRDEKIRQLTHDYRRSRERLANAVLDGSSDARTLETASLEKERAERRLANSLSKELRPSTVDPAMLAESIPPDTALLSYLQLRDERGVPLRYLALLLRAGAAQPQQVFDLGEAQSLDALMAEWGSSMLEGGRAVGPLVVPAIQSNREIAARVRERVWDPVADELAGANTVMIVPDGCLYGLAFAALPLGEDSWLLDEGPLLVTLSAERDLLDGTRTNRGAGGRLLCLGDPDFDRGAAPMIAQPGTSVFRGSEADCYQFQELEFVPLPQTAREIETVRDLWKGAPPTLLLGSDASEDALKLEVEGQSVLHLATHAFYLGSDCGEGTVDAENMLGAENLARARVLAENPLLLSGLALAGANLREEPYVDGILTAEEVAALDLTGVDLAVLSACQTGSGMTVAGEGVLGLRRAFHLAGADVLVTSLWPVEDEAAADWMESFYTALWVEGHDAAHAVREASLRSRQPRELGGLSTHPAHWAAFVAAR